MGGRYRTMPVGQHRGAVVDAFLAALKIPGKGSLRKEERTKEGKKCLFGSVV